MYKKHEYLMVVFDASYNHPSKTAELALIHTVGSYIASNTDWTRFRKEWRRELDKKGLDSFHMKDFEYAQNTVIKGNLLKEENPYRNFEKGDFIPLLKRLHNTINRKKFDNTFRLAGFTSSLVREGFDEALPRELKDEAGCQSHYIFNVVMIMEQISDWANSKGYIGTIRYIFAHGDREGTNLDQWFRYCFNNSTARKKFRLSSEFSKFGYEIKQMKEESAIQAADIVAYEFNKLSIKVVSKGSVNVNKDELRKSLPSLCNTIHYHKISTKAGLLKAFPKMVAFKNKHGEGIIDHTKISTHKSK